MSRTEIFILPPPPSPNLILCLLHLHVTNIYLVAQDKNLGDTIDSSLSFMYLHLKNPSSSPANLVFSVSHESVRLPSSPSTTLVLGNIFSYLNDWTHLLSDLPASTLVPLHTIQSSHSSQNNGLFKT